jgi:hypothetical protein
MTGYNVNSCKTINIINIYNNLIYYLIFKIYINFYCCMFNCILFFIISNFIIVRYPIYVRDVGYVGYVPYVRYVTYVGLPRGIVRYG